ncbi:hypothetical protein A2V82_07295 [candidate division KSB1 bacterium RBG_16_48_16]|nr:MAG: hypothetical protein A2V82_07295 [candidate division KSB1 bacterium RBG_16_48_16]
MNSHPIKTGLVKSLLLALLWHSGYFFQAAWPQEENNLPDYFTKIESGADLPQKIVQAANRFRKENSGDRFWVGYGFEPREDIHFHDICIHDDGGISISRGGPGTVIREEDDLKTHALHALSQLGDEEATKKLSAQKREFIKSDCEDWGVFYLLESESLSVDRIKLIHFRSRKMFKEYPVFWLGEQETNGSFEYLAGIIQNKEYTERVIEPAIFVISLHDHPQTIGFLQKIAGGKQTAEIRKSAAFWLGQIPGDDSFAALAGLFKDEKNRDMKEQIIFAISQHGSEKVTDQLVKIANSDPDFEIRKKAIFWLGQMAGRKTLEALGDIAESDDETEIKTNAIFAISQHKDQEHAVELLMDIARHNKNSEVRKKAMFWLGQTADPRAVAFFKQVLVE